MYKKIIFAILFILFLGIAYYGISPLFNNISLNEPAPKNTTLRVTNSDSELEQPATSTSSSTKIAPEAPQNGTTLKIEASTPVKGTLGHPASGVVKIITLENTSIIRYENFKTINGPDLYVYLSKDLQAKDFVSLGKIKATEGNINYEIPKDVNIQDYPYVLVWCKPFGVLFNSADISNLIN